MARLPRQGGQSDPAGRKTGDRQGGGRGCEWGIADQAGRRDARALQQRRGQFAAPSSHAGGAMSILLVDIGNSRIKWVLNQDGQELARGNHLLAEAETFSAAIRNLARPERVLACNVAGESGQAGLTAAIRVWGLGPQ